MPELDCFATAAVIASLDRRRREYRDVGWVYALRNAAFREPLLKVGMSSRPPGARVEELTRATGVPGAFELVYFVHVANARAAERHAHSRLQARRTSSSKEFFRAPLREVVSALDEAASLSPILLPHGRHGTAVLPQCLDEVSAGCPACGRANRLRRLAIAFRAQCGSCGSAIPIAAPGW